MLFSEYTKALSKISLLEEKEERALWAAFAAGDMAARARLIESYQPLVAREAAPYAYRADIMDVVQEGTVGLIEAAGRYDYRRGVAFSLFAARRIRGRIMDFLRKECGADVACLEEPQGDGSLSLKEALVDTGATVPEQVESAVFAEKLHGALDRLPQKEKAVLEGLYLGTDEAKDMAERLEVSLSHVYRLRETGIRRVRGMLARFKSNW